MSGHGPSPSSARRARHAARQAVNSVIGGVWYKKPNLLWVEVDCRGGDGSGWVLGKHTPTNGGTAGRAVKVIPANQLPASVGVTVGGVSGTSSFGSFVSGTGGGTGSLGANGGGGSGVGGDVNISGVTAGIYYGSSPSSTGYVIVREFYSV